MLPTLTRKPVNNIMYGCRYLVCPYSEWILTGWGTKNSLETAYLVAVIDKLFCRPCGSCLRSNWFYDTCHIVMCDKETKTSYSKLYVNKKPDLQIKDP